MFKTSTLNCEQFINRPLTQVFAFFENPRNLSRITPPELGFHILTPGEIEMKVGALIDYKIRVAMLPVHWRTLITAYDPPRRFVDQQLKGPYSFWHHEHSFVERDGGTLILDRVTYALPLDIGGLIDRIFVRPQLERIFAHRRDVIGGLFSTDSIG